MCGQGGADAELEVWIAAQELWRDIVIGRRKVLSSFSRALENAHEGATVEEDRKLEYR